MDTVNWTVEGMTCGGCVQKVRKGLETVGSDDIFIDLSSGQVEFKLSEPEKTSLNSVKKSIESLGFRVVEKGKDRTYFLLKIKLWIAAIFTAPLLLGHMLMMTPWPPPPIFEDGVFQLILCLPVYIIGVQYFGSSAFGAIRQGTSNMDVLIFMGTTAAFFYSLTGTILDEPNYFFYETAATIITLVLTGNLIEKRAIRATTSSIDDLTRLQQTFAFKLNRAGQTVKIPASEIQPGDSLVVNEGVQVPCDGRIIEGEGLFDESLLTGESIPVFKKAGDAVVGASVLSDGSVIVRAEAVGTESFLGKLIRMVKAAQNSKSDLQIFADKVSAVFVPFVLLVATVTFILSFLVFQIPLENALMNSIAVLVISCPCAMGLATPTAVMVGVGRAAKMGILPRIGSSFERMVGINHIIFDKTGTLTTARFNVVDFSCQLQDQQEVISAVYQMEQRSNHPIALTILDYLSREKFGKKNTDKVVQFEKIKEIPGLGVEAVSESGDRYFLGGKESEEDGLHHVHLLKNDQEIALITLTDSLKDNAIQALSYFKKSGVDTVLLSGDREGPTKKVAGELDFDYYYFMHSPEQKLKVVEEFTKKGRTAMVGDGVNDSVALARADIGLAFSSTATLAMQSADIVLLNDQLDSVVNTHKLSRKTVSTIKQNLFWAFSYNIVAIPMAALGFLNPMAAAFFMAFSDLVVIGNSVRLKWKKI